MSHTDDVIHQWGPQPLRQWGLLQVSVRNGGGYGGEEGWWVRQGEVEGVE